MQDLIAELEAEYNGKITWRTFSLWYADSEKNLREHGVFVFMMDSVIRFRDYEYVPRILGIEIKRKNKEPYVPLNGSFDISDIIDIYQVCKSTALKAIMKGVKAKKATLFSRLFRDTVLQVSTEKINYYFRFPEKEFRRIAGK